MKSLAVVLVVLATAAVTAGCATTRAHAPAARLPALEVPPVPPRVIEPPPPMPVPQPEPVEDLPPAQPTATAKPRPPRDTTQKPEPKPDPTTVEQPPVAAANPPASVPPLRTSKMGDSVQAERQIRDIIGRANALLGKVNYQKLSPERQKAYDQAKQFIEGAEGAIRDAKFEYALELADKAETLAKELQQ
jgi:hypothetical protein